jgi:hypothetical protein
MTIRQDKKKIKKAINKYNMVFMIISVIIMSSSLYLFITDELLLKPIIMVGLWIIMAILTPKLLSDRITYNNMYFGIHFIVLISIVYVGEKQNTIYENNFFDKVVRDHPQLIHIENKCGCNKKNIKNIKPFSVYTVVEINGNKFIELNEDLRYEYDEVKIYNYKEL